MMNGIENGAFNCNRINHGGSREALKNYQFIKTAQFLVKVKLFEKQKFYAVKRYMLQDGKKQKTIKKDF